MADDLQKQIHRGYLVQGDEIKVEGGFTLDFPKCNKWYYCLQIIAPHVVMLQGFKDEKIFKRRRSSNTSHPRERKLSKASMSGPCYTLTASIKIHVMEMCIGNKQAHVIILLHGTHPLYFKTLKDKDLREWTKAFGGVARIMENRNTETLPSSTFLTVPELAVARDEAVNTQDNLCTQGNDDSVKHKSLGNRISSDSGRGSALTSPRSSTGSDTFSPPSPSLVPNNIMIEPEEDEERGEGDRNSKLPNRRTRKSIYMKRQERNHEDGEFSGRINFTAVEIPMDEVDYESSIRNNIAQGDDDVHSGSRPGDQPVIPRDHHYDHLPDRESRPPLPRKKKSEPNVLYPPRQFHGPPEIRRKTVISEKDDNSPPPIQRRPARSMSEDQGYHHYVNVRSKSNRFSLLSCEDRPLPEPSRENNHWGIEYLLWEQSKNVDGLVITFTKQALIDELALVAINNEVWVAGWKTDAKFYGKLHVGDKIRQINDQHVKSVEWAQTCIQSSVREELSITITRLPNAQVLELSRIDSKLQWGIDISRNEIKHVKDGPAKYAGLTPKAQCVFSKQTCPWVVTEIEYRPVSVGGPNQNMVKEYIERDLLKLTIVVQPHDFVGELVKGLRSLKHHSKYYVG